MTNSTTALRQQMVDLTRGQTTETLTSAWVAALTARESAAGEQQAALDVALSVMSAELLGRGVSQDTLDTCRWTVRMQVTS